MRRSHRFEEYGYHGGQQKQTHRWYHHMGTAVWLLLLLCGGTACGYGLSSLLFRFTGKPGDFISYMISAVLGLLVLGGVIKLGINMYYRHHDPAKIPHNKRLQVMDQTIDALNRISRGDFSVLIPIDDHDPLSELAESVNKMAKELGSMENLRQDFISNVSHEIQSPLTSISGFAALLKSDKITETQRTHYIEVIENEARRLSKLSDNLLKLSSLESNVQPLVFSEFRLDKQIQNAALMLEPHWAGKDINLSLSLEKVSITGDEGLLSQVWINLLYNAVKFTPEQGEITAELTSGQDEIICRISDTGVGIGESDRAHIFERFYKADKSRDRSLGGNGLGLSLVKKIVELHDGVITVESELGEGSVFTVEIPKK